LLLAPDVNFYCEIRVQPQTSRATRTTSDSFAISASTVILLPKTVLEKPHCGLSASCSRGTYRLAWSMGRLRSSSLSISQLLVVTKPRTIFLSLGTKRSGAKLPPAASRIQEKSHRG